MIRKCCAWCLINQNTNLHFLDAPSLSIVTTPISASSLFSRVTFMFSLTISLRTITLMICSCGNTLQLKQRSARSCWTEGSPFQPTVSWTALSHTNSCCRASVGLLSHTPTVAAERQLDCSLAHQQFAAERQLDCSRTPTVAAERQLDCSLTPTVAAEANAIDFLMKASLCYSEQPKPYTYIVQYEQRIRFFLSISTLDVILINQHSRCHTY